MVGVVGIDRIRHDKTEHAPRLGGAAVYFALARRALCAEAIVVTTLGPDLGAVALTRLRQVGIEVQAFKSRSDVAFDIVYTVGADDGRSLLLSGVDESAFGRLPDSLTLSGAYHLCPLPTSAYLACVDRLVRDSRRFSTNVSSTLFDQKSRLLEAIPHATLCFLNRHEAGIVTGLAEPNAAAKALATRASGRAVVTGPSSVVVADGSRAAEVHFSGGDVVEPTGMGDAFAAGFAAATEAGADLSEAASTGHRLALLTGSEPGTDALFSALGALGAGHLEQSHNRRPRQQRRYRTPGVCCRPR